MATPNQPATAVSPDDETVGDSALVPMTQAPSNYNNSKKKKNKGSNPKKKKNTVPLARIQEFSTEELELAHSLFHVGKTVSGQRINQKNPQTTKLLATMVRTYCDLLLACDLPLEERLRLEEQRLVALRPSDWWVYTTRADANGKVWYYAEFVSGAVPPLPQGGRISKRVPGFMRRKQLRPIGQDALQCFPPAFAATLTLKHALADLGGYDGQPPEDVVLFETLELALRAEAAFWLERQFRTSQLHWYERRLDEMVGTLQGFYTLQRKTAWKHITCTRKQHQQHDTNCNQAKDVVSLIHASLIRTYAPTTNQRNVANDVNGD